MRMAQFQILQKVTISALHCLTDKSQITSGTREAYPHAAARARSDSRSRVELQIGVRPLDINWSTLFTEISSSSVIKRLCPFRIKLLLST